ncbi:MAG: CDP-glycerol glycerophosphotransferase family protein [Clostridiales Family XIII bacterium]|jgi:CDP-ribitol ribitolphosphotransferase|nr:CDP-glycerol glycerophosphotransferase family protein [Clostridiales Family XIII bacterium]
MLIIIAVAKFFLGIIYAFMKLRHVERKVVFLSRQGNEPSVDYARLAAALESEGVSTEMHLQRQEKDSARFMKNAGGNLRTILRQMRALATARVAVTDGYSIPVSVLNHRRELTVVQIWHAAGAVKKFGLQTMSAMDEREMKRALALKMHEGYDWFAAPSEATARFFAEAFGMGMGSALITGTPYLDALLDGAFGRQGDILRAYPELAENERSGHPRKVVLYVPTFRAGGEADEAARSLRGALDPARYILIEKNHPIADESPAGFLAEELIFAADAVVTDYSSLAFAAAHIGKPLFFYLYDIEEYSASPGLNVDPEREYGKYSARDAAELAGMLAEPYDAEYERRFARRYITAERGRCTESLIEKILSMLA